MRVKRGSATRNKHKKVLKLNKGYKGGQRTIFKAAMQAMMKALRKAYIGRKKRKRDMRSLWIQRISAQSVLEGISYSRLIDGLKKANISLNRKMLAELAVSDKPAFTNLVKLASKG